MGNYFISPNHHVSMIDVTPRTVPMLRYLRTTLYILQLDKGIFTR
jgi:hypothetical protein